MGNFILLHNFDKIPRTIRINITAWGFEDKLNNNSGEFWGFLGENYSSTIVMKYFIIYKRNIYVVTFVHCFSEFFE